MRAIILFAADDHEHVLGCAAVNDDIAEGIVRRLKDADPNQLFRVHNVVTDTPQELVDLVVFENKEADDEKD